MSQASASYKKKDGTVAVGEDRKFLYWTPSAPPNAAPSLTIPVGDIVNLQQTPVNNPKIALKVFVQASGAAEAETYVFSFASAAARKEQETITEVLRNAISALKAASTASLTAAPRAAPVQDESGQSASMAIAQAISSSGANKAEGWYDDSHLKADIELQKSLLDANQALRHRFNESLRDKPDTISITQFSSQFWSTRLHLLRAHAIEKSQAQGDYNVLPDFQYKRVPQENDQPDKLIISLAKEQIQLLFKQYPVVREAYNENTPQLDPNAFWSRFFNSRLIKRLRGEKITDADPTDPIFDKYLDYREKGPTTTGQVPHFIDLEGNEQNHSQRKGNRPDETMRPGDGEQVPILRVLNSLSEKMLAKVAPSDLEKHAPVGMDEGTYEELRLRDLQATDEDNRVKLSIKDQQRFLAGDQGSDLSVDALKYAKLNPKAVLKDLKRDLDPTHLGADKMHSLRLDEAIGVVSDDDDSDVEMEGHTNGNGQVQKHVRVGATTALEAAAADVMASIKARKDASSSDTSGTFGLSTSTYDALVMTHNTTIEFLHYFWTLFLSGDASRTNELAKLVETLDKSVDRIGAVSKTAEDEKQKKRKEMSAAASKLPTTSVKRRRIELEMDGLGGGAQAVEQAIAPTMRALREATVQYKKAFDEQSAQT